ncbi:MAG: hypothetical protein Q8P65_00890 [bacterium]|nr:hypothetical protein [bacterium]
MKIVPAILTDDINSFWDQINKLSPYYDTFQIDIMDKTYGENETISLFDIKQSLKSHADLTKKINLEFQLIIKNPEKYYKIIKELKTSLNINCIYFHYKIKPNLQLLYDEIGIDIGIAIDPDDSIAQLIQNYDIKSIKNIIIMTVFPRAQGQSFLEYSLDKIEQLRVAGYRYNISVDGGVNDKTIPLIFSKFFLPDFLNIGSFFSKSENLRESIKKINSIIQASSKETKSH